MNCMTTSRHFCPREKGVLAGGFWGVGSKEAAPLCSAHLGHQGSAWRESWAGSGQVGSGPICGVDVRSPPAPCGARERLLQGDPASPHTGAPWQKRTLGGGETVNRECEF